MRRSGPSTGPSNVQAPSGPHETGRPASRAGVATSSRRRPRRVFPSSSGAEQLTVNQRVGGSKPSWGARIPVLFIPMPGWWNGRPRDVFSFEHRSKKRSLVQRVFRGERSLGHAGLRCRWPKGRGGSNPFPGTIMTEALVLAPRFRGYSSVASRDLPIEGTVGLSSTASRV